MTIAIALKVGDGIVLGADSASSIGGGAMIANVYFNAEKVFNLVKGLPIGLAVAGLGGLSGRSIMSLTRDLRARIKDAPAGTEWFLDPHSYTIEQAAGLLRKFIFEEHYVPEFATIPPNTPYPAMSILVAGYSANAPLSEIWSIEIGENGQCAPPKCEVATNVNFGAQWRGQPEAINRLVNGWSTGVHERLVQAGITPQDALSLLISAQNVPLIHPSMPLQDAIDLVHFLIDVTIGFMRFAPVAPIVAPPIDSAAITKHEHFRWIRRKHYFSVEMNRPIERYPT